VKPLTPPSNTYCAYKIVQEHPALQYPRPLNRGLNIPAALVYLLAYNLLISLEEEFYILCVIPHSIPLSNRQHPPSDSDDDAKSTTSSSSLSSKASLPGSAPSPSEDEEHRADIQDEDEDMDKGRDIDDYEMIDQLDEDDNEKEEQEGAEEAEVEKVRSTEKEVECHGTVCP
jgi:hypothetical protein